MQGRIAVGRAKLIDAARRNFAERGVRWHMALFVVATAGIGMLASYLLLAVGLHVIWLRYVFATGVAYAGFLALIRWWIKLSGADGSPPGDSDGASVDTALDVANAISNNVDVLPANLDFPSGGVSLDSLKLPDIDLGDDDGIGIVVLLAVIALAALGGLFAAGFLIYTAPAFFAEVFVDAGLSYGLYRRLSSEQPHNWLQCAVARSWMPFLLVAVLLGMVGFVMHVVAPDAVSIGGVFTSTH